MATEPVRDDIVPAKFVDFGLHETPKGVGVSVTITSLEEGATTVVFTEDEAEELWQAMRAFYEMASERNQEREVRAKEN